VSEAREEIARSLRDARGELARVVEALERGTALVGTAGARGFDASLDRLAGLLARPGASALDARTRSECAALLDLVGVARRLAGEQVERARVELDEVRAVRARLGRQRERLEHADTRNCDVSA
jgi:predicted phosphoribosyltransferase